MVDGADECGAAGELDVVGELDGAEVPDEESGDELAPDVDEDPTSEDDFEDRESVR